MAKTAWYRSSYTATLHKKFTKELASEHEKLMRACTASSDPEVRAAQQRWGARKIILKMLEEPKNG